MRADVSTHALQKHTADSAESTPASVHGCTLESNTSEGCRAVRAACHNEWSNGPHLARRRAHRLADGAARRRRRELRPGSGARPLRPAEDAAKLIAAPRDAARRPGRERAAARLRALARARGAEARGGGRSRAAGGGRRRRAARGGPRAIFAARQGRHHCGSPLGTEPRRRRAASSRVFGLRSAEPVPPRRGALVKAVRRAGKPLPTDAAAWAALATAAEALAAHARSRAEVRPPTRSPSTATGRTCGSPRWTATRRRSRTC